MREIRNRALAVVLCIIGSVFIGCLIATGLLKGLLWWFKI
jgi:hypothetical protein